MNLTEFNPAWLPPPKPMSQPAHAGGVSVGVAWRMTVSYVDKCAPAVSGQGGHNATYRVACKIRDRLAGLCGPDECLSIMQQYNERCQPPWTEAELLHKLRSAWNAPGYQPPTSGTRVDALKVKGNRHQAERLSRSKSREKGEEAWQ